MTNGTLRTLWGAVSTDVGQNGADAATGLTLRDRQEQRMRYGQGRGASQEVAA